MPEEELTLFFPQTRYSVADECAFSELVVVENSFCHRPTNAQKALADRQAKFRRDLQGSKRPRQAGLRYRSESAADQRRYKWAPEMSPRFKEAAADMRLRRGEVVMRDDVKTKEQAAEYMRFEEVSGRLGKSHVSKEGLVWVKSQEEEKGKKLKEEEDEVEEAIKDKVHSERMDWDCEMTRLLRGLSVSARGAAWSTYQALRHMRMGAPAESKGNG